jgi:hypothetical protein
MKTDENVPLIISQKLGRKTNFLSVLWIQIRIQSVPGSGFRKAKITQKYRKKLINYCTGRPCIFSWPMMISNSVNEFFVAV